MNDFSDDKLLTWGKESIEVEANALKQASKNLSEKFSKIVKMILETKGKIVVTGLGKSGHVGRKIAATFSSTGTSSFFLHPTEGLHGDFGMLQTQDIVLALAQGGETSEVLEVAKFAKRNHLPVIAITGNKDSSLAKFSDCFLLSDVEKEGCPLNLAPTASSAVMLALGDALAIAVMRARGFEATDFAKLHPAGSLGRKLSLVKDLMHVIKDVPSVSESASFHEVLEAVTKRNFGIVPVLNSSGKFVGAISDGDVRRSLLKNAGRALDMNAKQFMSSNPKTILQDKYALEAFQMMEKSQITSVFVMSEKSDDLCGLIRMHDLLAAKIV